MPPLALEEVLRLADEAERKVRPQRTRVIEKRERTLNVTVARAAATRAASARAYVPPRVPPQSEAFARLPTTTSMPVGRLPLKHRQHIGVLLDRLTLLAIDRDPFTDAIASACDRVDEATLARNDDATWEAIMALDAALDAADVPAGYRVLADGKREIIVAFDPYLAALDAGALREGNPTGRVCPLYDWRSLR